MTIATGPKLVENGLLFTYDMYNNRSMLGSPGTNILPSPGTNGRFTTSNDWGTYNTNQYNGGNFFSIGTIASVSSNIITTSGNHPFRTYDAVQPQTSGGGLTANTNYFVKKISDTQFSLHQYNDSQNGTQGYINPSTGNFKVYDSIALDQRISVNSTSFPTMWWGYPHLPNTCHVKEIVTDGGYVPGTNCMRIHVTRTVGVDGGMAYGVYTPVTSGDVIAVSFWLRTPDSRGSGVSMTYTTYFGAASAFSSSTTLTTSWQKVVYTWTASATYSFYQYWFPPAAATPYDVDMADLQVQVNSGGIASNWMLETRSTTQVLTDLTANNTITANALTYANDNTFSFDGVNDYITANWSGVNTSGGGYNTVSMWMYWTGGFNGFPMEFGSGYRLWMPSGNLGFNTGAGDCYGIDFNSYANQWVHVAAVFYNGTYTNQNKIYINGTSQSLTQRVGGANSGTASASGTIGGYASSPTSYPFPGKLSYFTVHNRELTANEVYQNFMAQRGKYGV